MKNFKKVFLILMTLGPGYVFGSSPYLPTDSAQILEILPQPAGYEMLRAAKKRFDENATHPQFISDLVRVYILLGKQEADTRYHGYAESILKPYLFPENKQKLSLQNSELLLQWADILQYQHQYKLALSALEEYLQKRPYDPQAHLMRAMIFLSQGNYPDAMSDCRATAGKTSLLITSTCIALINSFNGKLQGSFALLTTLHQQYRQQATAEEESWALSALGEMAFRKGDFLLAEKYFRQGLLLHPKDYYLLAALGEVLLISEKYQEIETLLGKYQENDKLLLILALAEKKLAGPQLKHYLSQLGNRYLAAKHTGDTGHWREYARYQLHLAQKPQLAFELALENWQSQKESLDTQILIESALATKNFETIATIKNWLLKHKMEDYSIAKLTAQVTQ